MKLSAVPLIAKPSISANANKKGISSQAGEMPVLSTLLGALKLFHFVSLRTAVAIVHFKSYPVPPSQGLESLHINGREMNEYVWARILLNEPIPLLITKPFHDPFYQNNDLLSKLKI
jgi:hypothetical protein